MKILITLLASLLAFSVQAETVFEHFVVEDEWPALEGPDGNPAPNIIYPGEFFCTGGGESVGPFLCEGGKGIHIRGTEMISFVGNSQPYDPRVEGMAWFDVNANWDSDYSGPVMGSWRIEPYAFINDPDTYWEGTYTGKRELLPDTMVPTWISKLKFVGYGVGELAGQKMKATEIITTYGSPVPVPYELLPEELQAIVGTGPEGVLEVTIITENE
jgi:hypothetical protein